MNAIIKQLHPPQQMSLFDRAERIRSLVNVARGCIIEIGRELIAAKMDVGHGEWLPWLRTEFGWSEQTANRYMQVARAFQIPHSEGFDGITIDATALYALSAPAVPQEVRDEAVKLAEDGERITKKVAEQMVRDAAAKAVDEALEAYREEDAQRLQDAIADATDTLRDDKDALDNEIKKLKAQSAKADWKTVAEMLKKAMKLRSLSDNHYRLLAQTMGQTITVGDKSFQPIPDEVMKQTEESVRLAGVVTEALQSLAGAAPPAAVLASCYPVQRLLIRERLDAVIAWVSECRESLEAYDPEEKV